MRSLGGQPLRGGVSRFLPGENLASGARPELATVTSTDDLMLTHVLKRINPDHGTVFAVLSSHRFLLWIR